MQNCSKPMQAESKPKVQQASQPTHQTSKAVNQQAPQVLGDLTGSCKASGPYRQMDPHGPRFREEVPQGPSEGPEFAGRTSRAQSL